MLETKQICWIVDTSRFFFSLLLLKGKLNNNKKFLLKIITVSVNKHQEMEDN